MQSKLTPMSFDDAIEYVATSSPNNATIRSMFPAQTMDLESRIPDGMAAYVGAVKATTEKHKEIFGCLAYVLSDLGAKMVAPMAKTSLEANISVPLYAGDGIVIKITSNRFVDSNLRPERFGGTYNALPGVLPPIRSIDVSGYKIEVYPWIDRLSVKDAEVESMKQTLADFNLKFQPGDDRADNIGVMPGPGRRLAVLDLDAVELLNPQLGILTSDVHRWSKDVYGRFNPLYTEARTRDSNLPFISDQPDFQEQFSPLLNKVGLEKPKATEWKGFFR